MIDEGETERVQSWIEEAVNAGANVLTGGHRLGGALYAPTVLEGAPPDAKVCAEEAFAPLVVLTRFADFKDALAQVNASVSDCRPACSPARSNMRCSRSIDSRWAG